MNILKLFYFDLLRGLTKSWRRGIVCSWLVCANLAGSDPHSMWGTALPYMGCCFAPLTSIGPPPFFSLLQAGVLLYYFACAGPGEQTHTNKTGTHVAHSMGAGLALIRYALAGDNGIFARHACVPGGHCRKGNGGNKEICGDMMQPERRSISWLRAS